MTNTDQITTALRDYLSSDKKDMMPQSAQSLDRDDRRIFLNARDALALDKCPDCGGNLDHGTFLPTMTSDYDCEDCDFYITYPHPA